MDKKQEEIVAKKIESGEYFEEAMSWFHSKFTRPRTEASYFFIIAVIALAALGVGVAAFSRIFPLAPGANFVVERAITPNDNIVISGIGKNGPSVNQAVANYILKEYVIAREEYLEKNLDKNFRYVTANSDSSVNSEYTLETSLTNPQNPIVRYGNGATIEIKITDVDLLDDRGNPAKDNNATNAKVSYIQYLTFLSDNKPIATRYVADITFQYREIIVDQETGAVTQEPKLVVTGYKTRTSENS